MTKRGKVLRDPYAGPGLVMAEGRQYPFAMEGVWRSDIPPRPGLVVDLELDQGGQVVAIHVVTELQLAREQAEAVSIRARTKGNFAPSATPFSGISTVLATAVLALAGWFLTAFSIDSSLFGRLEFTFWQGLELLNRHTRAELLDQRDSSGAGLYGALAIAGLAAPFLHYVWKDRRAILAGVLPLLLAVVLGIGIYSAMKHGARTDAATLGPGSYLAAVASLYLASIAIRQFLVSKPAEGHDSQDMPKAA